MIEKGWTPESWRKFLESVPPEDMHDTPAKGLSQWLIDWEMEGE